MKNINLVPRQYIRCFRRRWYITSGIVLGILGFVILSLSIYLPAYHINVAMEEQVTLDAKLSNPVLIEVKDIIQEITMMQKEKSDLQQSLKEMDKSSHVSRKTMDIIVAHVPGGVRINQIIIDRLSNTASLEGSAQGIANVAQYMAGLYNTKQFQEISYTTSQNSETDFKWKFGYEIRIQLNPFQEDIGQELPDVEKEVFHE